MNNDFSNLNKETKINLALGYENPNIIEKFCSEYDIEPDLGKEYFVEIKKFFPFFIANSDHFSHF